MDQRHLPIVDHDQSRADHQGIHADPNRRTWITADKSGIHHLRSVDLVPWPDVLVLVKPDTVIGWHRAGFRLYWRWRSRPRGGRPKTTEEIVP